jgi:hypothetical protein
MTEKRKWEHVRPELLAELEVSAHAAEIVDGRWEAPVWDGERMMVVEFFAPPDGSTDAGMALFEVEDPRTDPEQRAAGGVGPVRVHTGAAPGPPEG